MRIAIVGAGVSGLVVAHLLHERHEVTVFEAAGYAGGHANTVRVDTPNETHEIDTGFIVFNDRNYPCFERLLERLSVASQPSTMSFGVSDGTGDFEYSGASPNGLFANRRHLLAPWFHRMVADLARFNRAARELLALEDSGRDLPLAEWLERQRFSRAFIDWLIVPQASAVWSADPRQMWSFPARFLAEFFDHHGMLGFRGRPRWRTVRGGSNRYVEALLSRFSGRLRLSTPVREITRDAGHVLVRPQEARPSASTRSCSRRTPTRRSRCSVTPARASARFSARSLTRTTKPCSTPTYGCCRGAGGRGRAGTTTWFQSPWVARRSPTT